MISFANPSITVYSYEYNLDKGEGTFGDAPQSLRYHVCKYFALTVWHYLYSYDLY
jgi:hypothetical protein